MTLLQTRAAVDMPKLLAACVVIGIESVVHNRRCTMVHTKQQGPDVVPENRRHDHLSDVADNQTQ